MMNPASQSSRRDERRAVAGMDDDKGVLLTD